jgi:hypothetical protein
MTMDIKTIHSLKSKFVARQVGNEMILVPITNNVAQMSELFTLNETAMFIWENITDESTMDDIESAITDTFTIDSETARKDIETFLNRIEKLFSNKN